MTFKGYFGVVKRVVFISGEYRGMKGKLYGQIRKNLSRKEPDIYRIQIDGYPKLGGWNGQVLAQAYELEDEA